MSLNINPSQIDTSRAGNRGFSVIQDCIAIFKVSAKITKNNSNPNYENMELEYTSQDPENPGSFKEWAIVSNSSEKATEIGHAKIAAIAKSFGKYDPITHESQIDGQTVCLEIGSEPRNNDPSKLNNIVVRYLEHAEWKDGLPEFTPRPAPPVMASAPAAAAPVASGAADDDEPWNK